MAVAVGDKMRGRKGALCAALGTILPSFFMILTIAIFLTPDMIKSNETLNNIFRGIRPAVVALIIAPVISSARAAKISWKTIAIPIVVALLIWSKLPYISNPIVFILLGGIGGYIWIRRKHAKISKGKEGVA
jgi:chromate transporter